MDPFAKTIFLSYAREDAVPARRISDALRAFGLSVWHDQSEQRGGEGWDLEVRKQISECALFMPVISANTQKRADGYFREEWRLAAERSRDIEATTPFLMPVVVDSTAQPGALVPEEFQRVPWTRLENGIPAPDFVKQVQHALAPAETEGPVATLVAKARRSHKEVWLLVLVSTVLVGGVGFFKTIYHHTPGTSAFPVVLVMDSPHPDRVFDPARVKLGGTNADDILGVLHDLPVTVLKESTSSTWRHEAEVVKLNPKLIVIHRTAFLSFPDGSAEDLYLLTDDKLVAFIGYVATQNPDTKFIIYSRRGWEAEGSASKWRAEATSRFPALTGRLDTWRVPAEHASFRDPLASQGLKVAVERSLGFKSGSASED